MTNQIISKQDLKRKSNLEKSKIKKRSIEKINTALINKSESINENLDFKIIDQYI